MKAEEVEDKYYLLRDYYLEIICGPLGVTPQQVIEYTGRKRELLEPKQVLRYVMKYKINDLSLARIGKLTDCDHCTVMHSVKIIENLLATDRSFRKKYADSIEMILKKSFRKCLVIGETKDKESTEDHLLSAGMFPVVIQDGAPGMLARRLRALLDCGSVYLLDGYDRSEDFRLEHQLALRLGRDIHFEKQPEEVSVTQIGDN
jgi:predicted DNA-binding protein YlxM (UPF0122 family)